MKKGRRRWPVACSTWHNECRGHDVSVDFLPFRRGGDGAGISHAGMKHSHGNRSSEFEAH